MHNGPLADPAGMSQQKHFLKDASLSSKEGHCVKNITDAEKLVLTALPEMFTTSPHKGAIC
jgi:hypothetical protein